MSPSERSIPRRSTDVARSDQSAIARANSDRSAAVLLYSDTEFEALLNEVVRRSVLETLATVADDDSLLLERDAARLLAMSRRALSELRQRGEIGFIDGKPVRYTRRHLRDWVARHAVRAR